MSKNNGVDSDREIVASLAEVTIDTIKQLQSSFDNIAAEMAKAGGEHAKLRINGLELTYFCLALTTKLYIQFSNDAKFEKKLDTLTKAVMFISLDVIGKDIAKETVTFEYQDRYESYQKLLNYYLQYNIYKPSQADADKIKEILTLRALYHVYGKNMSDDILFTLFIGNILTVVITELINFVQVDIRDKYFR